MVHKIFSVFDQKAKAYLVPFFLPTAGMAVRVFGDCVNDEAHQFGKHPEDYVLFELGSFDDVDGLTTMASAPVLVANGVQLVKE